MKTETKFIILCFFSGVFLSVVAAKPSPELMKELTALEKYLERKKGPDSDFGQNENQGEQETGNNIFGDQQNNNEVGDIKPEDLIGTLKDDANADKTKEPTIPEGDEPPATPEGDNPSEKPEDGVPPKIVEEGSGPNDQDSTSDGGEGKEEKPSDNNEVSNSDGEKEKGRDELLDTLDELSRNLKGAGDKLASLGDEFRKEFEKDDRKFKNREEEEEQTKEKTKEQLGQLKTVVEDIKGTLGVRDAPEKMSVQEKTAARKRQLSETEFLNIVRSLLTKY